MRRLRWAFLLVACLNVRMAGQTDRPELFGGYSLEHIAPGCGSNYRCGGTSPGDATNLSGWIASMTVFVYKSLGVSGQFTGGYNGTAALSYSSVHRHTYQVGPAYAFRWRHASAFAHGLFGGVSQGASPDITLSYRKFLWSVGGGLDLKMSKSLSVRPVQVDYERQHVPVNGSPDVSSNGLRYSAGVVLRF
jgi:hypothetical protein